MVIKPGRELIEAVFLYFLILITVIIVFCIEFNGYLLLFTCSVISFIGGRHIISVGRTLTMSDTGCKVSFLWYEKEYKWSELKVKRIEDYRDKLDRRWWISDDLKGAVFSPYNIYKEGQWTAYTYCMRIHPFSVFYVYLLPERELKRIKEEKVQDNYLSYVVEEKLFFDKMQQWNIIFQTTLHKNAYNSHK